MAKLASHDRRRRGLSAGGDETGARHRVGFKGREHEARQKVRLAQDGDPRGMVALKAQFVEWMRFRHCSAITVKNYDLGLEHFLLWCAERGVSRPCEVTLAILERYQRWLYNRRTKGGRPLALRTQQGRLSYVRAFFSYLTRHHHILSNPASDLILPRQELKLPQDVLSAQEAERVLAMPDVADALGLRDRAILETFYSTGIRRSELLMLMLYDLDRERQMLKVREGKGGKDRVVPIGERALHWIERYLTEVRPQLVVEPDCQALFLNVCGERLAADTLSIMVRGYLKLSGVPKKGACHLFRHTMATLMLEGGADTRFIQEMLGHKSLETTQIYTRVSPQKLKAIHAATHPAAKLERRRIEGEDEGGFPEDESADE